MEKIKVLQFVGAMNCGGTETMLMNILRNIDLDKYDFTFMVNNDKKGWYDDEILSCGANIIKVDNIISGVSINKYIDKLIDIFKENKFDVVHSHTFLHSGLIMYAAKKAGVKIRISHSHSAMGKNGPDTASVFKKIFLRKMILKYSTQIIACSTEAGLCLFGKKFLDKGILFKNPIRINEFKKIISNDSYTKNITSKYSIRRDEIILGHIGRFEIVKNHAFLIEIAKKLKDYNIKFKMFLIGEGILLNEIKEKVVNSGLEDNIIFTGNIQNVYEYINCFNLFLLPSFYEGLPLVAIEAQGFSDKCIISNRVSNEIDLGIGLVEFLTIDNGPEIWTRKIIDCGTIEKNLHRSIEALENNGYDINNAIELIEKIYKK